MQLSAQRSERGAVIAAKRLTFGLEPKMLPYQGKQA
jgi:hypothetical protein